MTPLEALDQLAVEGEMACDHFNDGDDILGWYGWDIDSESPDTGVLTVTYQHYASEDDDAELLRETFQWEMKLLA